MMVAKLKREICEGCCKQIYLHNKIITCQNCDKISHFECAEKTYTFDQIKDHWTCCNCMSNLAQRYNPFDSVFYNKYMIDDNEVSEEISGIKNVLENCQIFNLNQIDKLIILN